jgi:hypothetical protein
MRDCRCSGCALDFVFLLLCVEVLEMRWVGFEIMKEYEQLRRRYNNEGAREPYVDKRGNKRDKILDKLEDLFVEWQMCGGTITRQ